jgi:hypothetical protein
MKLLIMQISPVSCHFLIDNIDIIETPRCVGLQLRDIQNKFKQLLSVILHMVESRERYLTQLASRLLKEERGSKSDGKGQLYQ